MRYNLPIALLLTFTAAAQQKITLEDIWQKYTYYPKSADGFNVLKDGTTYADLSVGETASHPNLARFDLQTGKKVGELVQGKDLKAGDKQLDMRTYQFSPGEDKLLLHEGLENIYRRSPAAFYYVHDIASKKTIELHPKEKQMFPKFSPDGKNIAYVRSNNIYITDLSTGKEKAVASDGVHNKIKNGWADWVYEEEFSRADFFEWSPDGKYIVYCRFDETHVKEYTLDFYNNELYPTKYTYKYPKVGEANSAVSVHVVDTQEGTEVTVDIGTEKDIYIPRVRFTNDPRVICIQRLNRLQNKLEYIFADVTTGKNRVVVTNESKTYVDISDDLIFVGNKGFVISSEADGFNHLYYYDLNGKLIRQITKGPWDVMEIKGFDEKTSTLYYQSTERGAVNRDIYSVNLDGKKKKRLSEKEGQTDVTFANGYKFYTSTWSDANTPPVHELHSIDGKLVKVLQDNADLARLTKSAGISRKTFKKFRSADGKTDLNGYVMLPQNFDSTKKYPVFMYAYNGPGSNLVNNSWATFDYFWHGLLNQEGYMVVCVDGRGTQGRGRDFKHSTYLQLGKLETEDQVAVAKQLGELAYVDKSRIGFMGWSYGGYMASLMITKAPDLIKAAIAVAPVTNWKYYDNIYTERFMRTPAVNKSGYEDNSPVNFVKNIKGKYLLMHGSGDDNVHMQNSMEMANALVKHNIPFEFMLYPNKSHSIAGGLTRLHIYSKMLDFLKRNL